MPSSHETRVFLDTLWPPGRTPRGVLTQWHKQNKATDLVLADDFDHAGAGDWREDFCQNALGAGASGVNALGRHDMYTGVAMLRQDFGQYDGEQNPPPSGDPGRGLKADVAYLPGLFVDIDIAHATAHAAKNLPPDMAAAQSILAAAPMLPTMVVDSGYGLHAYWLFTEPLKLDTREDREQAADALELWQGLMITMAEAQGWHVDKTADICRVLRIPGTNNYKDFGAPKPVRLLDASGPRHDTLQLLSCALGSAPRAKTPIKTGLAAAAAAYAASGAATPQAPALNVPGPSAPTGQDYHPELVKIAPRLKNPDTAALITKLLAGEVLAPAGERDRVLQQVASIVAYLFPHAAAEDLSPLFAASLHHHDDVDLGKWTQADRIEWVTEKLERALQDSRINAAKREAAKAAVRAGICSATRTRLDPTLGPDETPSSGPYTAEDLSRFAAQQGCSTNDFETRWIIQRGPAFYVYVNGRYATPIQTQELAVSLPRDLAPAPVDWHTPTKDGGDREKKPLEMVADYGTVARNLVADLNLQVSHYDPATQTFHEAVAPRRDIRAAYDPTIDAWLRTMGGTEADKLLDWIACVIRLDQQCCALYLSGPPGTGKTMLAHGLARLWGLSGPTELSAVAGDWTEDMSKCPLVFADEQVSKGRTNASSSDLRALIGSNARTLKRKYQSNSSLVGALRLIMAANHENLLVAGDEDFSADDMEAVAGRFLHVHASGNAKIFLEALGGRQATDGWVDRDKIAAHALWLATNRVVVPGKRFLVEGHMSEMHRMLATQTPVASLVCEAMARYLHNPKKFDQGPGKSGARVGSGKLYVNTGAIAIMISTYMPEGTKIPSTTKIGKAMRNLAARSVKGPRGASGSRVRFWDIKSDLVTAWAESAQIGDAETMQALVDADALTPWEESDITTDEAESSHLDA